MKLRTVKTPFSALFFIATYATSTWATAQNSVNISSSVQASGWQLCSSLGADSAARLRCFDAWAAQQNSVQTPGTEAASANNLAADLGLPAATAAHKPSAKLSPKPPAAPSKAVAPVVITMTAPEAHNCKNPLFSELSRYWELEAGSDCGTFGIRGYHPISLSWIGADSVNEQPTSPSPEHSATVPLPFKNTEMRIGLSVRTKIAQGLLTPDQPLRRDSLWFGYSQQSNWQLFSGDLSRPFRTTDHEPELIYIYPTDVALPFGWRLRYSGISVNHQSNGQPLPLSRSWNRTILMAGMEKGKTFHVEGKLWYRTPDGDGTDDNPDIADRIGRAEFTGYWNVNPDNALSLTLRHSLRAETQGSTRIEWLRKLGSSGFVGSNSGLRLHTQLFSGYGDSLVDYNRRRTVLSVGMSLVDW